MTSTVDMRASVVGVSVSESPDMAGLGLSDGHLRDATAEIATHLLASGASLAYGGDLRGGGFAELLFELIQRYRPQSDSVHETRVTDYLAWPVHIRMASSELQAIEQELRGAALLALLDIHGKRLAMEDRQELPTHEPNKHEWAEGLTAMRQLMREETDVRVLLGGRLDGYKGSMPGTAEEALLSLQSGQPVFLLGGFGGCARDIAETIGLVDTWAGSRSSWHGRTVFKDYTPEALNNGLALEENQVLARTPYIDEAVMLLLLGLHRLRNNKATNS